MAAATVGDLHEAIRTSQLLDSAQLTELVRLQRRHADVRALGREVVQRGWLTSYQINQLLQGRGAELVLGPYLILDKLGEGGTGQVYKARHRQSNRITALKVLRKDVQGDADTVRRFTRELEVARQVEHPNLIHTHEAGPIGNTLVLAMEYVAGTNLDQLVKEAGPLPVNLACEYVRQAACGLAHAHERGLVHRDIKPGNLMVSDKTADAAGGNRTAQTTLRSPLAAQQVKILDLGLARLLEPARNSPTKGLTMLTGDSVMMGTPDYMSPEQALDLHGADIRSDIYSLGCTAFYLLTGQPPYPGGSLAHKLMKHQQAEIPSLRQLRPEVPAAVEATVQRMLAKRPLDRFQTPAEVAQALAAVSQVGSRRPGTMLRSSTGGRRRLLLAAVPLGLLLMVLAGAWLWTGGDAAAPARTVVEGTSPPSEPASRTTASRVLPLPIPGAAPGRTTHRLASTFKSVQGRPAVRDALIDPTNPTQRFGAEPRNNAIRRLNESTPFLIHFDVSKLNPPARYQFDKASVIFYVWDPHDNARTKVGVFAVKTPWDEATVTWNNPAAGKSWSNGRQFALGLDAVQLPGHVTVLPDPAKDTVDPPIGYSIEVTELVRSWLDNAVPNHGLALIPMSDRAIDDGRQSRFQINASEYPRAFFTPRLNVAYRQIP